MLSHFETCLDCFKVLIPDSDYLAIHEVSPFVSENYYFIMVYINVVAKCHADWQTIHLWHVQV